MYIGFLGVYIGVYIGFSGPLGGLMASQNGSGSSELQLLSRESWSTKVQGWSSPPVNLSSYSFLQNHNASTTFKHLEERDGSRGKRGLEA